MKNVRWLILIGMVALICGFLHADEYPPSSVIVGTNSCTVLPSLKPTNVTQYVTGYTNAQGTYFSVPANPGTYYWVVSPPAGGTNAGVLLTNYTENVDITDGALTIRSVPKTRNWYILSNISTSNMSYAEGYPAVVNKGIAVNANSSVEATTGKDIGEKCYQGEVNMISHSGTNESVAVFTK